MVNFLNHHAAELSSLELKKFVAQVHAAHEAAYHGHITALQMLSGAGANLDATAYNGNTPLHLAASSQQLTCVRYLAQRGIHKVINHTYFDRLVVVLNTQQ